MNDLIKEISNILLEVIPNIKRKGYPIIYRDQLKVIINDEKSFSTTNVQAPDYNYTFYSNTHKIFEELNVASLESIIHSKYPFLQGTIGTRYGGSGFSAKRIIEVLLKNILSMEFELQLLDDIIKSEIELFVQMIEKKKTTVKIYIPLPNLTILPPTDNIKFKENIIVKKLTEDEINRLFIGMYGLPYVIRICRYSILVSYEEDIIFQGKKDELGDDVILKIESDIKKIVYSLNISSSGSLGVDSRYYEYSDYFQYFNGNHSRKSHKEIKGSADPLNENQINLWKATFLQLLNTDNSPFELALRRLNEAETRIELEDSIVDSVIGLESLLLNDIGNESTRGEMKYRFCVNYSTLFQKDERKKSYALASSIYDLRSIIVHGSILNRTRIKFNSETKSIDETKKISTDMLRFCISKLLEFPSTENINTKGFWLNRVLSIE